MWDVLKEYGVGESLMDGMKGFIRMLRYVSG